MLLGANVHIDTLSRMDFVVVRDDIRTAAGWAFWAYDTVVFVAVGMLAALAVSSLLAPRR